MRIKTIVVLLMLTSILFAGCIGNDEPVVIEQIPEDIIDETPEEVEEIPIEEPEVVEEAPVVDPQEYFINMRYNQFTPSTFEINRGDIVTWINYQDRLFILASEDELWDDFRIVPGRRFDYTFNESGTYNFSVTGLPRMSGSIVVN